MATITFEARNLVSELLDNAAHDHNTLMMDIYGEIESEVWEAHITIIFNPLRFRRGSEGKIGDFWYGNTGANIVLDLKRSGVITKYTNQEGLVVGRKSTVTLKRSLKLALKPEVEFETAGAKAKGSPGELATNRGKEIANENTYEFTEFPLDTQLSKGGSRLEWRIQLPIGQSVIRPYLYGNKFLCAKVQWTQQPRCGSFHLETDQAWFYNRKGNEGIADTPEARSLLQALESAAKNPPAGQIKIATVKGSLAQIDHDVHYIRRKDNTDKVAKQPASKASNKATLVARLSEDAGITKIQATAALDSFVEAIVKTLKGGGKVTLAGFGTFSVSKRAARAGRNPQTGAVIKIKAKKVAKFKAGKELSGKI